MLLAKLLLLLLPFALPTTADFFISNTTVCHGMPMHCPHGAQVITAGANIGYTCDGLITAQDNASLRNGTMGPFGSTNLWADNICGSGRLNFIKQLDAPGYDVQDEAGNAQGECIEAEDELVKNCDLWVTNVLFRSLYRCTSPICKA